MPTFICHHDGLFFEWSTVVDAPVSAAMSRDEFEQNYLHRFGYEGMRTLPERLARAVANGTSARHSTSLEDMVAGNRAGDDDVEVPLAEIVAYVIAGREEFGLPRINSAQIDEHQLKSDENETGAKE